MIKLQDLSLKKNLIVFVFVSFFFQSYYIDVGYAIKLYMFLIPLAWCVYSSSVINTKFLLHEKLLFVTIISFCSTSLYSYDVESSIKMIFGLIFLILYYVIFISALKKLDIHRIYDGIFYSGIIFNVISLILYVLGIMKVGGDFSFLMTGKHLGVVVDRGLPRLSGPLNDPNFYVAFNSLFLFFSVTKWKESIKGKLLLPLCLLTMFLTMSIGGYIAFFSGFFVYSIMSRDGFFKMSLLLVFLSIIIYYLYETTPFVSEYFEIRTNGAGDGSGRFEIWSDAFQVFLDNPFGIGIYSFLKYNIDILGGKHYMHNTYLELLVEGGVFVFLLYVITLIVMLFRAFRLSYSRKCFAFIFPSLVTICISFISLSGFASELWVFYLGLFHYFILFDINNV
ncbi:O-antigen ligase family protein [Vibrio cholerae]